MDRMPIWLMPDSGDQNFPDIDLALTEPDGLLAVGGDLSAERLLKAYRNGIFPWFNEDQPILWWSPNPRMVLFPDSIKISRSLRKTIRRGQFQVSCDRSFREVLEACAAPRADQQGTWISSAIMAAYGRLHQLGFAHSIEVRDPDGQLQGGLYGVAIGQIFFGESMFSRERDSSKIGLVALCQYLQDQGFRLIDCQVHTDHLQRLGAMEIPRGDFRAYLDRHCSLPPRTREWPDQFRIDLTRLAEDGQ